MSGDGDKNYEALASIDGLFLPDDLRKRRPSVIEFFERINLIELDSDTEKLMFQTETIRRVGSMRWGDKCYALHVPYEFESDDPVKRCIKSAQINKKLQEMLECLRIHQSGMIFYGGIIHRRRDRGGEVDIFHIPWHQQPVFPYAFHNSEELEKFGEFWKKVRTIRNRHYITLALRWHSRSFDFQALEDRVITIMVALEALTRPPKSADKKADYIASTVVDILSGLANRDEIKNKILNFYNLRNEVIHRGDATSWIMKDGNKPSREELNNFVNEGVELVRQAINAYIRSV